MCNTSTDTGSISREEAAYLAGIIDGEGCFRVNVGKPMNGAGNRTWRVACRLTVVNTAPEIIRRLSEIYAKLGIRFNYLYEKREKDHWKDRLSIVVTNDKALVKVLHVVMPYLTAKREEALTLCNFILWRLTIPKGEGRGAFTDEKVRLGQAAHARLAELKSRSPNLQRLPRPANQVLSWDG